MKHYPTPTDDPIVCVHIGRSTWQGPASEAPKLSPSREAAKRAAEEHKENG